MNSIGLTTYHYFPGPVNCVPPIPLTRSIELHHLHEDESRCIQQTAANNAWTQNYCADNVANLLELLPYKIANKLKVVLSTHELELLSYYGNYYKYHVFLLGLAEDGLKIIDVASTCDIYHDARDWLSRAFNLDDLKRCFFNDRFLKWLPQFRFIEGNTYRLFSRQEIQSDSSLLTPNLTVKHRDERCFFYHLWNDSFFLNMHETWQLFSGLKTYGESVALHRDGLESPRDRLTDNCIRELREALGLF